jgi:acetyl-CoA synthetase
VQHSTGGYLLHAALTTKWTFDLKADDVFWCTADIGWVTGHTYITYGPLALGGTEIVFEGVPTYPDAGRFWKMIQDHKVSDLLHRAHRHPLADQGRRGQRRVHPKSYDLTSLRILGSVGEPINPAAWEWYHQHVGGGRCPIVDTFWQTETGGHMITPLPGATPLVPGSCTLPFPGIQAAIVDETGKDVPNGQGGILVIKRPWPSHDPHHLGRPGALQEELLPRRLQGQVLPGRRRRHPRRQDGYFTITGRIDDVLNVSGHRMGTMEIESRWSAAPSWWPKPPWWAAPTTPPARPSAPSWCSSARAPPATRPRRSPRTAQLGGQGDRPDRQAQGHPLRRQPAQDTLGKIMRRLLRSIAKGEAITQDTSTLENPAILDQLAQTLSVHTAAARGCCSHQPQSGPRPALWF